ncbi:MAG: hypothetical protein U0599_03985 [Vicinamibacteria bacterium]
MLGVEVPLARMPVAPGRNIALLVEVAAHAGQLLRGGGLRPASAAVRQRVDEMVGDDSAGRAAALRGRRR